MPSAQKNAYNKAAGQLNASRRQASKAENIAKLQAEQFAQQLEGVRNVNSQLAEQLQATFASAQETASANIQELQGILDQTNALYEGTLAGMDKSIVAGNALIFEQQALISQLQDTTFAPPEDSSDMLLFGDLRPGRERGRTMAELQVLQPRY